MTVSATGPAASLGIPEKNTFTLLPTTIAGQKVEYIVLDDGSDTTKAVANTRKLITEDKVDIVIGTQMLFRLALQAKAAFVAVPDADAGLHIPDFRSAERMYHGLVDAADLALPATAGGRLLVGRGRAEALHRGGR